MERVGFRGLSLQGWGGSEVSISIGDGVGVGVGGGGFCLGGGGGGGVSMSGGLLLSVCVWLISSLLRVVSFVNLLIVSSCLVKAKRDACSVMVS